MQSIVEVLTEDFYVQTLSKCLQDDNEDVRQAASSALSGVLRCSRRSSIEVLKVCNSLPSRQRALQFRWLADVWTLQNRFVRDLKSIKLPARRDQEGNITPSYQRALVQMHAAVLGVTAL